MISRLSVIAAIAVAGIGCAKFEEQQPGSKEGKVQTSNVPQHIAVKPFEFPTNNRHLLQEGDETNFFARTTVERPWQSGSFGCVRNSRTRLHEGIDILWTEQDDQGESTDQVRASRSGTVAYINSNSAASNYGKYVVLSHELDDLPVYTLYAHLRSVDEDLRSGQKIQAGETIGILGRTTNTRDGIAKWRAHLHFEVGLQINSRFNGWFKRWYTRGKNLHGPWNGLNLLGLDAAEILKASESKTLNLTEYIQSQPVLCTVRISREKLDWVDRFPKLVEAPAVDEVPVLGWELDLGATGIPMRAVAVTDPDLITATKYRLLDVNETVRSAHPCSGLVFRKGQQWVFTSKGQRLMDLLIFR